MTEQEEKAYVAGERAVLVHIMKDCARQLGYEDPLAKAAAMIAEREGAVRALRELCEKHGDNDWPDNGRLADVIEKHLGRHLGTNEG